MRQLNFNPDPPFPDMIAVSAVHLYIYTYIYTLGATCDLTLLLISFSLGLFQRNNSLLFLVLIVSPHVSARGHVIEREKYIRHLFVVKMTNKDARL